MQEKYEVAPATLISEAPPSDLSPESLMNEAPLSEVPSDVLMNEAPSSEVASDVLMNEAPLSEVPSDVLMNEAPSSEVPSDVLMNEAPLSEVPSDVLMNEASQRDKLLNRLSDETKYHVATIGKRTNREKMNHTIREICSQADFTLDELCIILERKSRATLYNWYISQLLAEKKIQKTSPEKPTHPEQKYRTILSQKDPKNE